MNLKPFYLVIVLLLTITNLQAQFDREGKDFALFFAVNDYQESGFNDLRQPIKNAQDLAKELSDKYGFQTEVVENPDFATINAKIKSYHDKFANGEYDSKGQLLIFFAGHGLEFGDSGYFVSADGSKDIVTHHNLEYNYCRTLIDQIPCQHILVAIDACYSKTFDPLHRTRSNRQFGRAADIEMDQVIVHHNEYKARIFLTSDSENQESPDASAMVQEWLRALRTHSPNNGYLSASELFGSYLRLASPTPGAGTFASDEAASRFLFFLKGWRPGTPPGAQTGNEHRGPIPLSEEEAADKDLWEFAQAENSIVAYQIYIQEFPMGNHIRMAKNRLAVLEAQVDADESTDSGAKAEKANADLESMKVNLDAATLRRIDFDHINVSKYQIYKAPVSTGMTKPGTTSSVPKVEATQTETIKTKSEKKKATISTGRFGSDYIRTVPVATVYPSVKYNQTAVTAAQKTLKARPTSVSAKRKLADAYLVSLKGYDKQLDKYLLSEGISSKAYSSTKKTIASVGNSTLLLYKDVEKVYPNDQELLSSIGTLYKYLGNDKMRRVFAARIVQHLRGETLTSYFKSN